MQLHDNLSLPLRCRTARLVAVQQMLWAHIPSSAGQCSWCSTNTVYCRAVCDLIVARDFLCPLTPGTLQGNVWQQLWQSTQGQPASQQQPIISADTQASSFQLLSAADKAHSSQFIAGQCMAAAVADHSRSARQPAAAPQDCQHARLCAQIAT